MQEQEDEFGDAVVLAVFREESDGQEGLARIREAVNADFVLALDEGGAETAEFGMGPPEFETFFIDPDGTISAILTGETYDRPTGSEIVKEFVQVHGSQMMTPAFWLALRDS